jgi:diacylglycerol kinase (ATP)
MMDRYLAILNPAAGGGKSRKLTAGALKRLRDGGLDIEVVQTERSGDGTRLAEEGYRNGYRNFLAIGGDGTSYEVINGLFPLKDSSPEGRPTLGFLPMGTGNSFLRDFTNGGAEYTITALLRGQRRPCDVIEVKHSKGQIYFINIFSIGFVADVNSTRQERFRKFGEFGYVLSVFSNLRRLKARPFPMTADGHAETPRPLTFVSINNSRFTGGKMMMAPHAETNDGRADLISVDQMGRLSLIKAFPKIFNGSHVQLPTVSERKVSRIDFDLSEEVDVMVDGEAIRIRPQHLQVIPGAFDAHV